MKKEQILKKYFICLAVLGCIFGLAFGVLVAKANSSGALEGRSERIITASEIAQFIMSKFYS